MNNKNSYFAVSRHACGEYDPWDGGGVAGRRLGHVLLFMSSEASRLGAMIRCAKEMGTGN
jgi:hypothetical protein